MHVMPRTLLCGLLLSSVACRVEPEVTRIVDGRTLEGAFVEPEAYAAYLRGAIAEARGDDGEALRAYAEAARRDPADPEVWTRVGAARCKLSPRDAEADRAIERALAADPRYAPAWAARAQCSELRGKGPRDGEAAQRAAEAEP